MAKDNTPSENAKNFDPALQKPIFEWSSPDRLVYKKNAFWYLAIIALAIILGYILYTQHLWSGMVLVFTAAIAFMALSQTKPRETKCSIYSQGIVVDDKVYKYNDFKSFWLTYIDIPKVRLQLSGLVAGQVVLPLQNIDARQVRLYLSRYLPEDTNKGEDLVDIANRFLRF